MAKHVEYSGRLQLHKFLSEPAELMAFKSAAPHFLHLQKKKYRKQRRTLRRYFADDSFRYLPRDNAPKKSIAKYWSYRHDLFSLIDQGNIHLTEELWYSVTPERVAKFTAAFIEACLPGATTILDVFCGGGGNVVHFAKVFQKVYGVELKLEHLYCTYRNAEAYGVADRVWLKHGDWLQLAARGRFERVHVDCVFASPPWGGIDYTKTQAYDLETQLQPAGLSQLLSSFLRISANVVLFLPKNSNLQQLSEITRSLLGPEAKCKVLYARENGRDKGLLCFWGEAFYNFDAASPANSGERLAARLQEAHDLYG
ncbi:FACR147Cp [Eremothecium gossypii FDAG1]|nr:FACR147Cp [Eremothecium gossypii FDAG1]